MSIDFSLIREIQDHAEILGVHYVWGVKPDPAKQVSEIAAGGSDCSGWIRYILARAAGWSLPEGSQEQMGWAKARGWELLPAYPPPAKWSIWFALDLTPNGHPGHVYISDPERETVECYGGHGVGSRSALTPILRRIVHAGFLLPT